jgi:hypothetical protein
MVTHYQHCVWFKNTTSDSKRGFQRRYSWVKKGVQDVRSGQPCPVHALGGDWIKVVMGNGCAGARCHPGARLLASAPRSPAPTCPA